MFQTFPLLPPNYELQTYKGNNFFDLLIFTRFNPTLYHLQAKGRVQSRKKG